MDSRAENLGHLLKARSQTVATAESCTGGLIGDLITDVPGSSSYFLGGAIVYSNAAKQRLLGVSKTTLQEHGAVSEAVAIEMAARPSTTPQIPPRDQCADLCCSSPSVFARSQVAPMKL